MDPFAIFSTELTSGEAILWTGQPNAGRFFHQEDVFLIPFSLLWGGFAIFWEGSVLGLWASRPHTAHQPADLVGVLWGIPFLIVGQYLIWGRFFYTAWKKRRTYYAVTNRRAMVVQDGWSRRVVSAYLDNLPTLEKELGGNGIGTLRFAPAESIWSRNRGWSAWDAMALGSTPTFVDIQDVDSVYQLVSELREKSRTSKTTPF